jgi:hypothetical protein
MNKRKSDDKEKIDLMKWVNALKQYDPIRKVDRVRADSRQEMQLGKSVLTQDDMKVGLICAGYFENSERIKATKVIVSVFIERMMRQ